MLAKAFAERVWSERARYSAPPTKVIRFDELQLMVSDGGHAAPPVLLWSLFEGRAVIDRHGGIEDIEVLIDRKPILPKSYWSVPVESELFRMLAASIKASCARQIASAVYDMEIGQ